MVAAKVWQLVRQPEGEPTREDFKCVEETLPPCEDGGEYPWLQREQRGEEISI